MVNKKRKKEKKRLGRTFREIIRVPINYSIILCYTSDSSLPCGRVVCELTSVLTSGVYTFKSSTTVHSTFSHCKKFCTVLSTFWRRQRHKFWNVHSFPSAGLTFLASSFALHFKGFLLLFLHLVITTRRVCIDLHHMLWNMNTDNDNWLTTCYTGNEVIRSRDTFFLQRLYYTIDRYKEMSVLSNYTDLS